MVERFENRPAVGYQLSAISPTVGHAKTVIEPVVPVRGVATISSMPETPTYSGKVRILDMNGVMYDVGKAELEVTDPLTRTWGGSIRLFDNSALANKSITSFLELEDGSRMKAQVGPQNGDAGEDLMTVAVVGLEDITGF